MQFLGVSLACPLAAMARGSFRTIQSGCASILLTCALVATIQGPDWLPGIKSKDKLSDAADDQGRRTAIDLVRGAAILAPRTAAPIMSAGRRSPRGPLGIVGILSQR
jgi:hypothetical protein